MNQIQKNWHVLKAVEVENENEKLSASLRQSERAELEYVWSEIGDETERYPKKRRQE